MKKQTLAKLLVLCLMLTMVLPVSAVAEASDVSDPFSGNTKEVTISAETKWTPEEVQVGYSSNTTQTDYSVQLDAKLTAEYIVLNDATTLTVKSTQDNADERLSIKGFKITGNNAELKLEKVYVVSSDTVYFEGKEGASTSSSPTEVNVTITGGKFDKIVVGAGVYVVADDAAALTKVDVKPGGKCIYYKEGTQTTVDPTATTPTPTPTPSTPSGPSTPVTPPDVTDKTVTETVKPAKDPDGGETAEVSKATVDKIVEEAVNNKADNINLKVDSTADKATVTLPAESAKNIADKTDAAVNVVTNNATVTIPNSTLNSLAGEADKNVGVTVEKKTDNTVTVSVTADGKPVSSAAGMKATLDGGEKTSAGTVIVIVNEDGSETIVKKSIADKDGNITAPLAGGVTTLKVIENNSMTFSDIGTVGDWAAAPIDFVSSRQLFTGVSESEFAPNIDMSRAMLATVLYRLEDAVASGNGGFDDVPSGEWYTEAVGWAAQNGIVNGTGNGFEPNGSITRQDMATMLYRYAKTLGMDTTGTAGATSSFTDSGSVADYAAEAMNWAVSKGLINGMGDGTLNPTGNATRAQVSAILMRLVEIM